MRVALVAGKAVSLLNVAKDIAYVAQKRGHVPRILKYVEAASTLASIADGVVLIYPASPLFCGEYMLLYRDLKINYDKPVVYYTMVEGRPRSHLISKWMLRDLEFVAVSNYVKNKLMEVGFSVRDVVYHGLVRNVVYEGRKMAHIARKQLEDMHGGKVVFGVISHSHVRKGLDALAKATVMLSQKRDDFVVHVVTNPEARKVLADVPNMYIDTVFGSRSREEIMAFLSAIDFLIVPSYCEGFGLPLIEANACGTPAVHCLYPPLSEISNLEANIVFNYNDVEYVYTGEGIEYEFHLYDPRDLADAMEQAIDIKLNFKSEMEERMEKAANVLHKFDAEKLYAKLLGYIGA